MSKYPDHTSTEELKEPDLSKTYTAADYIQWTMDYMVELIRGRVFKMSAAPNTDHQIISVRLTTEISNRLSKESNQKCCSA